MRNVISEFVFVLVITGLMEITFFILLHKLDRIELALSGEDRMQTEPENLWWKTPLPLKNRF